MSPDVLLILALLCGCAGVAAFAQSLAYTPLIRVRWSPVRGIRLWWKCRQVQRELDAMPELDFSQGYSAPRDPRVSLNVLPMQKVEEIERRRLRLVVGGSSRGL
ncbi:MAG: hypothetical protein ABI665_09390 [Vicinamibacterales bacterium]